MQRVKNLWSYFYDFRFELLSIILVWILFGGTIIPHALFDHILLPLSVLVLAFVSIATVKNERKVIRLVFGCFAVLMFVVMLLYNMLHRPESLQMISLSISTIFFMLLSLEVFKQMVLEKSVTRSIIFAAFDCYLLLGIIGATLFTIILNFDPTAFSNTGDTTNVFEEMLYFSFITITSIGYGDITPVSSIAQKLTAFFGLIAHFYSVVIVGIIVGKYVAR